MTKAVLEEKLAHQFLQVHEEGDRLMKSFVQERFAGSVSIWEPISRRKLPTFGNNSKSTEIKVRDRVLTLKKSDAIRTCKVFAKVFVARVLHAAESYSEVRLIFDRYIASSLKRQANW